MFHHILPTGRLILGPYDNRGTFHDMATGTVRPFSYLAQLQDAGEPKDKGTKCWQTPR